MHGAENRRFQRQAVALRLRLLYPGGEVETFTDGVSRGGFSARLPTLPGEGEQVDIMLYLPDGAALRGRAECRNVRPGPVVGFSVVFDPEQTLVWDDFIDQEEATGGLWRMLNRYVTTDGDVDSHLGSVVARGRLDHLVQPRGTGAGPLAAFFAHNTEQVVVRLHTVGENGEAYRIAFEKHPSTVGSASDLVRKKPGFQAVVERSVNRILDEKVLVRLNDRTPIIPVRVCELARGGYAYIHDADDGSCGLVSLVLGELILVEVDGQRMFPHFDDGELERIACDTVRHDIERPVFRSIAAEHINPELNRPLPVDAPVQPVPLKGLYAIRFAQARAERVQTRTYGDRTMRLFPELWARATDREGNMVMGPTMEDGPRLCMLALVGHRAPRVVRLHEDSEVEMMRRPGGRASHGV